MSSRVELDLRGVVLPVCLLKCKSALAGTDSEDVLEVLVEDSDVVDDLVKIIERSQDRSIKLHREDDHYRIRIEPQAHWMP